MNFGKLSVFVGVVVVMTGILLLSNQTMVFGTHVPQHPASPPTPPVTPPTPPVTPPTPPGEPPEEPPPPPDDEEPPPTPVSGGGSSSSIVYFRGKAYPGAELTLLTRDNIGAASAFQIARNIPVQRSGFFFIQLGNADPQFRHYSIAATDKFGTSAQSTFYEVHNFSRNTTIDVFIPPTISLARATVRRGDFLVVHGSKFLTSRIAYRINGEEGDVEVAYPEDGVYRLRINTADLEFGTHTIQVRQIDRGELPFSGFSILKNFVVSRSVVPETDLNNDGRTDISDWSIFLFRWNSDDEELLSTIDFNHDGKVDISDFSIFVRALRR